MSEIVWVSVIVMAGLVAIVILWQVLDIGKGRALQEGQQGDDELRAELNRLSERLSALESRTESDTKGDL
ncbi:hypothetical protein [Aquisalimonas sp.]|uniref:hypothetical protein n=1 Tax=Aquisalimonas sp. TaxID=1872621 RepID=UPI0025C4964E|nr:hypothetical protein [Aquisalimonas sp.]